MIYFETFAYLIKLVHACNFITLHSKWCDFRESSQFHVIKWNSSSQIVTTV